ncbi:MAG: hypothetical protein ACXVP0_16130 [Bacteroidia bacterium]
MVIIIGGLAGACIGLLMFPEMSGDHHMEAGAAVTYFLFRLLTGFVAGGLFFYLVFRKRIVKTQRITKP